MKEKEFRKIVREEIKSLLDEAKVPNYVTSTTKSGPITDLISKFYLYIIRHDLESAQKYFIHNPELLQLSKEIKNTSKNVANELLKDKNFVEFLKKTKD